MRNLLLGNTFRGKCLFVISKTTCVIITTLAFQTHPIMSVHILRLCRRKSERTTNRQSTIEHSILCYTEKKTLPYTKLILPSPFRWTMVAHKINFSYYIGFYIVVFDTYMPEFLFILKPYRISVHKLYALSYSAY